MRIILTKATEVLGKIKPVNTAMVVTIERGKQLIENGEAKIYGGVFPPKKKQKMNLSQLNK